MSNPKDPSKNNRVAIPIQDLVIGQYFSFGPKSTLYVLDLPVRRHDKRISTTDQYGIGRCQKIPTRVISDGIVFAVPPIFEVGDLVINVESKEDGLVQSIGNGTVIVYFVGGRYEHYTLYGFKRRTFPTYYFGEPDIIKG